MNQSGDFHPTTGYAKTSDIKGRTYLEYRRDMKRKAIAELEVLEWLREGVIRKELGVSDEVEVTVSKAGTDRDMWFLREGKISREPDYIVEVKGEGKERKYKIEFQYAEKEDLSYYDFKISKISKKQKNNGYFPRNDLLILYINIPMCKYAFLEPTWIVENGKVEEVPAWRTQAYRVNVDSLNKKLKEDERLNDIIQLIKSKKVLLEFQHKLYDKVKYDLGSEIEKLIQDNDKLILSTEDLKDFFKACVIVSATNKVLSKPLELMQKALDYCNEDRDEDDIEALFQICFCLDLIYFYIPTPKKKEQITAKELEKKKEIYEILGKFLKKTFADATKALEKNLCSRDTPPDEVCSRIQYALFCINVAEDIVQDCHHYSSKIIEGIKDFPSPVSKIYQSIHDNEIDLFKLSSFIQNSCVESNTIT